MPEKITQSQDANDYRGPLAGLNVIDFGHYYAGPMAGMLLADQGANVIRIVKPGGPELPGPQYRLLNRNKKLLELDLKTEEGRVQALSLIERADVLIENFRPGVMKRLGLDYSSVKELNPGLVYLSLPGFSSRDKERAHIQAWEGVIAAASGIFTEAHALRQKLGFPPLYASVPLSSAYGSMYGATAVMAALIARKKDGQGTVIEAPLVEAGLSSIVDKYRLKADPKRVKALPDFLKPSLYSPDDDEETQLQKLTGDRNGRFFGTYKSSDGRDVLVFTVKEKFAERAFKALGIDEKLKEEGFVFENPWKGRKNNNLADLMGIYGPHVQRARKMIGDIIATRTADEWEAFFANVGVPCTYIRTRDGWLTLAPLLRSGVLAKMNKGESEMTVPGRVTDMSGPNDVLHTTAPKEPEVIGPHGQFAVGPNGYQRLYACGDKRWIYVHAEEGRASRFAEVVTGIAEADERALEAAFAGKSSEHWLKKLDDADIACHAVLCAEDICVESRIRPVGNEAADEVAGTTLEIFGWDDHPSGRPLMMPSMSWVRVGEDHSYLRLTPTPKVGAHTKEILT